MSKQIGLVGQHDAVEDLEQTDVNGRQMFRCGSCGTFTRNKDHFAEKHVPCITGCRNCDSLRDSNQLRPAVPVGRTCNAILHTCPLDGRRWWQSNDFYHMWQQVTDPEEWRTLIFGGYDRPDSMDM